MWNETSNQSPSFQHSVRYNLLMTSGPVQFQSPKLSLQLLLFFQVAIILLSELCDRARERVRFLGSIPSHLDHHNSLSLGRWVGRNTGSSHCESVISNKRRRNNEQIIGSVAMIRMQFCPPLNNLRSTVTSYLPSP